MDLISNDLTITKLLNGSAGANGYNAATVYLYLRAATQPSAPSSTLTYTFTTGALTPTSALNGWKTAPENGSNPCWVAIAAAISNISTDEIYTNEWSIKKLVENGSSGVSITGVVEQYAINNNSTTAPTTGWSTSLIAPTSSYRYLWNREVISYSSGDPTTTTPHIAGMYSADGKGISSIVNTYAINNDGTTAPATGWEEAPMAPTSSNKYLWNKEVVNYTTGIPTTTTRVIGTFSEDGYNLATIYLYLRTTATSVSAPTGYSYTFSTDTISPSTLTPWSRTIPSGNDPCWVTSAVVVSRTDSNNQLNFVTPTLMIKNGASYATVYLYKRGSSAPAKPNGDVIYTFSTGAVSGLLNSWTRLIPTGTDPCWMIVALATASAGSDTDTISSTEWSTQTKIVENGANGAPGAPGADGTDGYNTATVFLYKRGVPTSPATNLSGPTDTLTYTFTTGLLTASDPSYFNGWSLSIPAVNNDKEPCWVTTAAAISLDSSIDINTNLWSQSIKLVEDGEDGDSGNNYIILYYYKRTTDATVPAPSGNYTYNFSTNTISSEPQGWSTSFPTGNNPCWVTVISFYGTGSAVSGTFSTPVKLVENGEDGLDAAKYFITYNLLDIYRFYLKIDEENDTYDYIFSPLNLNVFLTTFNEENQELCNISPLKISSFKLKINTSYPIEFIVTVNNLVFNIECETSIEELKNNFNNIFSIIEITNNNTTNYFGYSLNILALYNKIKVLNNDNSLSPELKEIVEKVLYILQNDYVSIETQILYDETNEISYYPYGVILIKNGIDENMLKFTLTAANITAAIGDNKLIFNAEGLTICNGAFVIKDTTLTAEGEKIFYYDDESHLMYVKGSGTFTGIISALEGNIGGFVIDANSIYSVTNGEKDNRIILCSGDNQNRSYLRVEDLQIGSSSSFTEGGALTIGGILTIRDPKNEEAQNNGIFDVSKNENVYFRIMENGSIVGKNWNIDENGSVIFNDGTFTGNVYATDGIFNGTIYATAGEFTGKIKSSEFESGYITATTLDVVEFITLKARSMGGAFIFKTTLNIKEIENYGNNDQVKIIFDSNDYNNYITDLDITNYRVALSNNQGIWFGTINSKDSDYVIVNCDLSRSNVTNSITITLLGRDGHKLFAINSDDGNYGGILPERSLSILEYNALTSSYSKKLILGDLESAGYNGYGLYADNVYLKGSLATELTYNDNNKSYAGISTRTLVMKENERVMFWAGAKNEGDIINSPFIVTEKGSIYASKGVFSGSIISESIISRSTIEAATILGTEDKGPSLKIFNTLFDNDKENGGIGFYRREIIDGQENDELTLRITDIGLFYKDNSFIKFDNNNVIFKLDSTEFSKLIIKDQVGNDGKIALLNLNGIKENGYSKLSYNTNYINITDTLIENYSNQTIINKELIVKESENLKLDYRINGSYYCLFVN